MFHGAVSVDDAHCIDPPPVSETLRRWSSPICRTGGFGV